MSVPVELVRVVSETATGALFAAVWQGALLAGAAALGVKLLPKTPAGARFAIWFAVFAAVVALPFVGLLRGSAAVDGVAGQGAWLVLPVWLSVAVAGLWVAASLWRAASLVIGAVKVRALWRRAEPVELPEAERLVEGERKAQICVSDEVDRPSVIGFFAPKILIPGWLLEKLSPEEMEQVVLHEAGHLRRADDWLNLLQKLALVLFPLNPALVWIERRLCFERELACDERVLRETGAPKAYASCLAALAEHRMNRRSAALVMAALGRESELGQRVARILAKGETMRPRQARLVMGVAVLALAVGAAGLERCPELVGFGGQPESLAVPVSSAQVRAAGMSGFRAQDAMFHAPDAMFHAPAVKGSARPVKASAPRTAPRATMLVQRAAAGLPVVVKAAGQGSAGVQMVRAAVAAPRTDVSGQAQWVVMTAWRTLDGGTIGTIGTIGTVVMTSVVTQGAAAQAVAARQRVQQGQVQQYQDQRVGQDDDSPVFSPYAAAVPVRGGWLVVQL